MRVHPRRAEVGEIAGSVGGRREQEMALDKAIAHGKEYRRLYRKSEAFDRSCRPHGGCPYCERRRMFRRRAGEKFAARDVRAFNDYREEP